MPQIPNVSLSPTPRSGLTSGPGVIPYQDTSMQKFSAIGQGIQKLGQVVTGWARKAEDEINDARTMEATNAYEFSANKLVLGWRAKKGQDATSSREDLEKQLSEVRESSLGMLDNDVQRRQFVRLAGKISTRANLSIESYYLEAASQDKQQQLLARRAIKSDSISSSPLTISADHEILLADGSTETVERTDINPEVLSEFGQFFDLAIQEGNGLGYKDDRLALFVRDKTDELFTDLVNQTIDSDDPKKIEPFKKIMQGLPDGVMSNMQRKALIQKLIDKSDSTISGEDIVDAYGDGRSLQDVHAQADQMLDQGVYTEKQWSNHRKGAESYYRQQRDAEALVVEGLLNEVQSLKDQGQPIPAELRSRAAELGKVDKFDEIVEGNDDWLPEGQQVWADYELNPARALEDYKADPKGFIERLDAMMPWRSVQQILNSAKVYENAQSGGRGRSGSRGSSISANLVTGRGVANGLLQQYAHGVSVKSGSVSYRDSDKLTDYSKTIIERRWREALQPLVEFEMSKDPELSVEDAVNKVAPELWKSGEYNGAADGKPRNKWSEASHHISGFAASLENEVNEDGEKLTDLAREEIQRTLADKAFQRRTKQERRRYPPPTTALLGMPEADQMRSNEEIRQQVAGEMKASMELFGVPIASDDSPLYVSQEDVYDLTLKMIGERKDKAIATTEAGKARLDSVAIGRLDRLMSSPEYARVRKRSEDMGVWEGFGTDASNLWNWVWSKGSDPYVARPIKHSNQMSLALEYSKTMTVMENGKTVNPYDMYMQNYGDEDGWIELVGHHAISNYFLDPKPSEDVVQRIPPGRMQSGTQGGTTYSERAQMYADLAASNQKEYANNIFLISRSIKGISRSIKRVENNLSRELADIEHHVAENELASFPSKDPYVLDQQKKLRLLYSKSGILHLRQKVSRLETSEKRLSDKPPGSISRTRDHKGWDIEEVRKQLAIARKNLEKAQ